MNMQTGQTLYTAKVHTTGGREGSARSADGRLDVKLSAPGGPGSGINPEQLFAAGWSACFEGAMGHAARQLQLTLPVGLTIDAEVDLARDDTGFFLRARLNVHLPEMPYDTALTLVAAAHRSCPYSKAVRGNVDAAIYLV